MTQSNKAQVDRWMGGSGNPENLKLQLISDGGIVTTATGALAVCDPFAFRCGIFERGTTKMSHVFGHMGRRGLSDKPPWLHPDTLVLDAGEHLAYVAADTLSAWGFLGRCTGAITCRSRRSRYPGWPARASRSARPHRPERHSRHRKTSA